MSTPPPAKLHVLQEQPAELQQRVLPTLNLDGSRRFLYPRQVPGRFLKARRILAYVLIGLFTVIPYLQMNGKPLIFLDIVHRRFTAFGTTFLATDTLLFLTLMLTLFLGIFMMTALFGRAWCGWACPQTVYMEFLFRPIERLIEGGPRAMRKLGPWGRRLRGTAKHALYTVLSMYLAHTFLAHFVSVDALTHWVTASPAEHPEAFGVMATTTVLMLINFGSFREQTCMVACPYGRFQSVLLDERSLIIGYDEARGEPRGKLKRRAALPAAEDGAAPSTTVAGGVSEAALAVRKGDCVNCGACVAVCPTGVDIRDGLQMECIHCTQCIDACDSVMDKLGKPRGLIRYTSKEELLGKPRKLLRWRTVLYPVLMAVALASFAVALGTRAPALVTVLRGLGNPYTVTASGEVTNQIRIKVANRSEHASTYAVELHGARGATLIAPETPLTVASGDTRETSVFVVLPQTMFKHGLREVEFHVKADDFEVYERYRLLGPSSHHRTTAKAAPGGAR